jgi:hypothetical protein
MRFKQSNSVLAGLSREQLQAYFQQAQQAYISLLTGSKPVTVSYEGKSVTYTQANKADLKELLTELGQALGQARPLRAIRPYFR